MKHCTQCAITLGARTKVARRVPVAAHTRAVMRDCVVNIQPPFDAEPTQLAASRALLVQVSTVRAAALT